MGFYRDLSLSAPIGTSNIRDGDNEILAIKTALHDQWPNWISGPANPTLDQINALQDYVPGNGTVETRLARLEAQNSISALPSAAYDFNDSWWQTPAAQDEARFYSANQVSDSQFSNAPWPWGNDNVGGRNFSLFVQKFINNGQGVGLNFLWRRNSANGFTELYWRYATSSGGLPTAPWMRATYAEKTTGDGSGNGSGVVQTTSARAELTEVCPGDPCP